MKDSERERAEERSKKPLMIELFGTLEAADMPKRTDAFKAHPANAQDWKRAKFMADIERAKVERAAKQRDANAPGYWVGKTREQLSAEDRARHAGGQHRQADEIRDDIRRTWK